MKKFNLITYGNENFNNLSGYINKINKVYALNPDAEILAKEIFMSKIEGLALPQEKILRRYEQNRRLEAFMFGLTMEVFHRGYSSRNSGLQFLRSLGMNRLQESDHLKQFAMSIAADGFFYGITHLCLEDGGFN